jgi:hypothetical protein
MSSLMLHRVALVRNDVSEEGIASIIRVTIGSMFQWLVTANVFRSSLILVTLLIEAACSSETSVLTTATRHRILEDGILLNID